MSKFDTLNERERRILRENGMDPEKYCVVLRGEDYIVVRCFRTRDDITIRKGDRTW